RRYSRQVIYEPIGVGGQRRRGASRAVLIGCGALGTVLANTLVRAGLGFLRICDRDFIERDNLQRQVLFDEADIEANLPKAVAAAAKLGRINSDVTVEAAVVDVNPSNIERLCEGADILLDGTDNSETRFLINDLAIKTNRPWVYGAVIGATGLAMPIIPGETACLRCVFENAPPPEMNPTCDTVGVLGPIVNVVASIQAIETIKLLIGARDDVTRSLIHIDLWSGRFMNMNVQSSYENGDCPCCKRREFTFLDGAHESLTATLCGRNAVQINRPGGGQVDLAVIAERLQRVAEGPVRQNRFMLKAVVDGYEIALFPDGRAIIKGVSDPGQARSVYAKYIGS
ncbi:MAG: ThiF family adenylyltransferase, partial [Planctomycetes bacterium]|nr:ThiF family adenylyltransferase [Planctomycetota bacterium]